MSHAVVQQPNGKFLIFSSVSEGITAWDCDEDEVISYFIEHSIESTIRIARNALDRASGKRPQFQHMPTFEECVERNNKHFPNDQFNPKDLS